MSKRLYLALLFGALIVGFWLRWEGLGWGRSNGAQFHPDEPRFIEQAEALDAGTPLRKSYVFGFGQAIRWLHSSLPSADCGIIGRCISLTSGMLICLVVFAVARQLKLSTPAAALAAALTSLNTMCVIHSHFGTADMTYVLFLYLFALAALRGWLLIAAVVTGFAMATKFGMILLPSLLWLVCSPAFRRNGDHTKAGLQAMLLVLLSAFVFVGAQGFTFDSESIRMIALSAKQDNIGGFEHQKWQNIITYLGVAIRSLGIPVFIFAVIALARTRWRGRSGDTPVAVWIALLPFALHAVGLLAINTAFPRHFLPLIPLLLIIAAGAIEKLPRFRTQVATVCLVWSAALSASDARSFDKDNGYPFSWMNKWALYRGDPREWLVPDWLTVAGKATWPVWGDSFFWMGSPELWQHAVTNINDARIVFLHEGWTWRFERSEINPLHTPDDRELYHATKKDLDRYRGFKSSVEHGEWKKVFDVGPINILPEQFLYSAAWGSFEKFAGRCTVYERVAPQIPVTGNTTP